MAAITGAGDILESDDALCESTTDAQQEDDMILQEESAEALSDADSQGSLTATCSTCRKEFALTEEGHDQSPDGRTRTCPICVSRKEKKLRLHKLLHSGVFESGRDSPTMIRPAAATAHVSGARKKGKQKVPCPECGKGFNSSKDMKRHLRVHTGEKPHTCDICGKAFSQTSSLRRHLITHTSLRPHRCEVCGLTFKGHLARHMRSHTGEKPFTCEICLKGFFRSEHLKKHLNTHIRDGTMQWTRLQIDEIFKRCTTLKLFKCDDCGKTYTNSGHLARHMRVHSREKLNRCVTCGKCYKRREHLRRHAKTHNKTDSSNGSHSKNPDPGEGKSAGHENHEEEDVEESVHDNLEFNDLIDWSSLGGKLLPEQEQASTSARIVNGVLVRKQEDAEMPRGQQEVVQGQNVFEHECERNSVTCGLCGETWCCPNSLTFHLDTTHSPSAAPCRVCGKDIGESMVKSEKPATECQTCANRSEKVQRLDDIIRNRVSVVDPEVDESPSVIAPHIKTEGSEAMHDCSHCSESFSSVQALQEHVGFHKDEKTSFLQTMSLQIRGKRDGANGKEQENGGSSVKSKSGYNTRGTSRTAKTSTYKKVSGQHTNLKENKEEMKGYLSGGGKLSPSKHHACPICRKVFKGGHLARHLRTHARARPFSCTHCFKSFTRTELLKSHLKVVHRVTETLQEPKAQRVKPEIQDHHVDVISNGDHGVVSAIPAGNEQAAEQPEPEPHDCTEDRVNCGLCGYACCCTEYIARHMETHTLKTFTCRSCGTSVQVNQDAFDQETEGDAFTCDICKSRGEKKLRLHQILRNRVGRPRGVVSGIGSWMRKRHRCPHCSKCFRLPSDLRDHVAMHRGEMAMYSCTLCDASFSSGRNLRRHMRVHRPTTCRVCGKAISGHMARHMRTHSGERPYTCEYCFRGFYRSEHLKRHLDTHQTNRPKPYKCGACGQEFQRKYHLKRHHQRTHTKEDLLARNIMVDASQDSQPNGMDDGEAPLLDGHADSQDHGLDPFSDAVQLQNKVPESTVKPERHDIMPLGINADFQHVVNHQSTVVDNDHVAREGFFTGGETIAAGTCVEDQREDHICTEVAASCEMCGHSCCCINQLLLHIETHNMVSVHCGECRRDFSVSKGSLKESGVDSEAKGRSYRCEECKARQYVKEQLGGILHRPSDEGVERPLSAIAAAAAAVFPNEFGRFPCPQCDRSTKCRKDLRRHMVTHSDERPFSCDICGKSFAQRSGLKRHAVSHTGAKPHCCPICNQAFSGHLARHMRTHLAQKPFACQFCDKTFHRAEHLKRHVRTHLKEGPGAIEDSDSELGERGVSEDGVPSPHTSDHSRPTPPPVKLCPICGKGIRGRLARHLRSHTGEKPHQCPHCPKAFLRPEHLRRHLATHNGKGAPKC